MNCFTCGVCVVSYFGHAEQLKDPGREVVTLCLSGTEVQELRAENARLKKRSTSALKSDAVQQRTANGSEPQKSLNSSPLSSSSLEDGLDAENAQLRTELAAKSEEVVSLEGIVGALQSQRHLLLRELAQWREQPGETLKNGSSEDGSPGNGSTRLEEF